jgi:SurA N-terminal domain
LTGAKAQNRGQKLKNEKTKRSVDMILERFRQLARTWPAKVMLGLLVAGIAVFAGMSDLFNARSGLSVLGKVGDVELLSLDFKQQLIHRIQSVERSLGRPLSIEDIVQLRLPSAVLTQMVQQSLLDQEADSLNLVATDDQVREAIRSNPLFHNKQGTLDPALFESFLRSQRIGEPTYVTSLRQELKRMQLIEALLAPIQVPESLVTLLSKAKLQKRLGAYVLIPAAQQSIDKKPDEKTLRAFHQKYAQSFIQLEMRNLTVLLLDKALAARKTVAPSATDPSPMKATAVNTNAEQALQLLGKQVEDALASGETLEEVAQKFGLQLQVIGPLNVRGEAQQTARWPSNLPASKAFQALFIKKAFGAELKEDQPLEWVPGGDMAFVLRVDTIIPEKTLPFEDVQETVWTRWKELRRYQLAFQEAVSLADQLNTAGELAPNISFTPLPWIHFKDLQKAGGAFKGELTVLKEPLFEMGIATFRVVPGEKGVYVLKLLKLQQAPQEQVDLEKQELAEKAGEMLKNDLIQAYVQSLKNRYMVRLNDKVIGNILAGFGF